MLLAIVVFGPPFTFSAWTSQAQKDPVHRPFVFSTLEFLNDRLVLPGAGLLFLSGIALIFLGQWDLSRALWLDLAIILFLLTLGARVWVAKPITQQMGQLMQSMAQGSQDPAIRQQMEALGSRLGRIVLISRVSIIIIIFLMVVKPF